MIKTYIKKDSFKELLKNTLNKYDYAKKDIKDIIRKLNIKITD